MITLIAAIDDKRGIGKNGSIPWHNPEDLEFFKQTTENSVVIMGRHTWKSLGKFNRPLPNRHNIIVSNKGNSLNETGCNWSLHYKTIVCKSLNEAYQTARGLNITGNGGQIFIIGGQSIYEQTIDIANRLLISHIPGDYGCDRFFPPFEDKFYKASSLKKKGFYIQEYHRK